MIKVDKIQLDIIINGDPARKELLKLEDDSRALSKELRKLPKDSEEFIAKTAEFEKIQNRIHQLKEEIGLTGMSLRELRARQAELNAVFNKLPPSHELYGKYKADIDAVKNRIAELTGKAAQSKISLSGIADGFNKYFGMMTAFAATFTGVVLGVRKAIDAYNDFEQRTAKLSSLTGLAGEDLKEMGDEAKRLSTSTTESGIRITQSAGDIVDAYTKMGSAKPELLKNKEALKEVTEQALILSAATGQDLDSSVQGLANTLNQFNAPASEAGKFVNVLAAGSKEGAKEVPYISEAIVKFGAVAKEANVGIEQSVGLIETLGEKGFQAEIAGTGLKTFFVKLLTGADETNPKVVGMSTALENLSRKFDGPNGMSQMAKLFGQDNVVIAKSIIDNRDNFNKLTTAITDTNVAYEQAKTNTETNSAKLEQAKNKVGLMAIELGEKLAPALTFSTNGLTYFLRALLETIKFTKENSIVISSALVGLAAYALVVNGATLAKRAYTIATNLAARATRLFDTVSKTTGWGLIAGLIAAAVTALILYKRKTDELISSQKALNDIQKEYKERVTSETAVMNTLFDMLKKENLSKEEKSRLINKLNESYGQYLPKLLTEKSSIQEIEAAMKLANKQIENKILLQIQDEKITSLVKEREAVKDLITGYNTYILALKDAKKTGVSSELAKQARRENPIYVGGVTDDNFIDAYTEKINEATNKSNGLEQAIKSVKKEYGKTLLTGSAGANDTPTKNENTSGGSGIDDEEAKKLKKLNEDLAKIREDNRIALLAEDDKEIEQVKAKYKKLEDEAKGNKNLLKQIEVEKNKELYNVRTLQRQKHFEEEKKQQEQCDADLLESNKKYYQELQNAEDTAFQEEQINLIKQYTDGKISKDTFDSEIELGEIAHQKILLDIKRKAGENVVEAEYQLQQKLKVIYERNIANSTKETKALVENRKRQVESAYSSSQAYAENLKANEVTLKGYLNVVRNEIKAVIAQAVAKSVAQALIEVPFPFNIALGTAAGIGVTALFNSIVPQFADGLYPVTGNKDGKTYMAKYGGVAKTGVVNEPTLFLAGEQMPEVIIDGNTFRNMQLRAPEIMTSINHLRGVPQYAEGLYPVQSAPAGSSNSDTDMMIAATLAMLNNTLQGIQAKGISANISYDQIKKKTDEMNAIIKDVSL